MNRRFLLRTLAVAFLAVVLERPAVAQTQTLNVDALSGVDSPTSSLYKSIRYAVSVHVGSPPGTTSRIMVRGRRSGGNAVLHDNTIEGWNANGPIVLPANLSVEWDTANSDVVGGAPTPVVVTGNQVTVGSGVAAFRLDPTAALTRANLLIKAIQIVAFDVGVDWKPSNGGLSSVGATLDTVRFNQCVRGLHIEPAVATPVDPLVSACSFENTAQAATIGGDRPGGLISLFAHVDLVGVGSDVFRGDYNNNLFTSNSTNAGGTAINVLAGFSAAITIGCSATFTVADCDFQGNGTATGVANGMLHGFYFAAVGVLPSASFLVRNSYFQNCGYTGLTLIAAGQGVIVSLPEGGWNYDPPETHFLTPEIRRCTFVHNGYVAASMGAGISLDIGHGIVTRTWSFGQMQPFIHLCDGTGTSAGHMNLGITNNAFDGIFVHSDWWLPEVNNPYQTGNITYTRNDTWLETSRIFTNFRHGVEILLQEGSGNPGTKGNRIFNDAVDGVHIYAIGGLDPWIDTRDKVVATPVTWNNFVYNTNLAVATQQNGIWARYIEALFPLTSITNILGGVGVLHNTSTRHAVDGIDVRATLVLTSAINSVQSNIAYFNTNLDLVLAGMIESYNDAANATGPTDITANPLLVNYIMGDLHLTTLSPCINAAPSWPPLPYSQYKDDFDLQLRPIGPAFEIGADELR